MKKTINIPKILVIACCLLTSVLSINKLDASVSLNGSLGGYNFGSGHVYGVSASKSEFFDLNVVYNIIAGSEINPLISQYNIDNAWNDTASNRAYLYYKLTICTTAVDVTSAGPNGLVIYQYITNQSCPVDKYTGKLKYIYLNLKLTKHLRTELEWWQHENSITFTNPSSTSYRMFNVKSFDLLSPSEFTEEVTSLTNNEQILNSLNKLNDLNNTQIQTNSKLNDLNNKQQQTNNKLDDLNNKQNQTNSKLDDLNNKLTDTSAPDTSGFGNVSGWLPAGPVDSILTLPLKVMNTISGVLSGSCSSISLPLPFIDSNLDLPCGDTFYDGVTGLSVFLNTLGLIVGGYLLYCYLIYLYNWVDKKVSMVENDREKWGVV